MTKIVIAGGAGRMGKRLIALSQDIDGLELAGALEMTGHPALGQDAGLQAGGEAAGVPLSDSFDSEADVMIDFTLPQATQANVALCVENKLGLILGTTGLSDDDWAAINEASKTIPFLVAPNFSLVVNVLFNLAAKAAVMLGDEYDIEVLEAHHRFKQDAPSGTAMKLAEHLCNATNRSMADDLVFTRHGEEALRKPNEITMQTLRIGDHPGEHTAYFAALGERLEIKHVSTSRDSYASGALKAAGWLDGKAPGSYSMNDVLGLE